jgi:hypothetical protein
LRNQRAAATIAHDFQHKTVRRYRVLLHYRLTLAAEAVAGPLLIGYARVSTEDQRLDLQRDALALRVAAPPATIASERGSGPCVNSWTESLPSPSVVAKAQRSPSVVTKQTTGRTEDGLPVHSFRSLIADLATLARNTVVTAIAPNSPFTIVTRPTRIQQKALDLLAVTV